MVTPSTSPACKQLVLDAGPLLSLSPLRDLAETYVTVPQVLDELKDKRAREHFEKLGLSAGVQIKIQSPDPASLAHVIQIAKKTGDYSVLSHPDLCVIALTYALEQQHKKQAAASQAQPSPSDAAIGPEGDETPDVADETPQPKSIEEQQADNRDVDDAAGEEEVAEDAEDAELRGGEEEAEADPEEREPLDVEFQPIDSEAYPEEREPLDVELQPVESKADDAKPPTIANSTSEAASPPPTAGPVYDDPSDEDDGEGEWITPSNVALHKSRALGLTPAASLSKKGKPQEMIHVGCMTADFAMQNVLLQMNLSLVGVEGKKIEKVKTWVLRCHACFKICKDNSKKFCPSCGSPTLLRASVTISSPSASSDAPTMQVHLKKNFQYKTRGTIYSIPSPKPGSAKTGTREGLILREDQTEYMRAQKRADTKRQRDEKKMLSGALNGSDGALSVGNWMDPDWIPDIISAGASGKGRKQRGIDMPTIGYGRRNPNERRRHK